MALYPCDHCKKEVKEVKLCIHCNSRQYCSKECILDAWKSGHKQECEAIFRQVQLDEVAQRQKNNVKQVNWNSVMSIVVILLLIVIISNASGSK
jgi:hypothetical protein